jgi:hypothetical protein
MPLGEEPSYTSEVSSPMLDVHTPHEPIHTWKSFGIHILAIAVGLLIAVGLEQTLEYVHHRREVADTREALRRERFANIERFHIQTDENRLTVAHVQASIELLRCLQTHPGAGAAKCPGTLRLGAFNVTFSDAAWTTAQQSNVLQYMPPHEVELDAELYRTQASINSLILSKAPIYSDILAVLYRDSEPAHLTPAELDKVIDLTTQYLFKYRQVMNGRLNLAINYPDFSPGPTRAELSGLFRIVPPLPEDAKAFEELRKRTDAIRLREEPGASEFTGAESSVSAPQ